MNEKATKPQKHKSSKSKHSNKYKIIGTKRCCYHYANVNPCCMIFLTFLNICVFLGFKEEEKSYQAITWLPPEDYNKEFMNFFDSFMKDALDGR